MQEDRRSRAARNPDGKGTIVRADDGHVERRRRRSEHALSFGLAATSIAMMVGARSGAAAPGEETTTNPELLTPPAERAEKKGVTWDLHHSEHERIDFFVEFLMGRNYDRTRSWLERMGKYGPMIQNELRERGMPEDLLYLTMIESGLNPNAYSRAHAAGLCSSSKKPANATASRFRVTSMNGAIR